MKIIILNAGIGERLKFLTKDNPKCLIKIHNNNTILDIQLKNLIKCNLKNIIMVTGYLDYKIKNHIDLNYPTLKIQYVKNPIYYKTNYIYSMYLTKDFIDDDIILLHGDLIFSNSILGDLINSKDFNCVLVNKNIIPPKKDFKALIIDNKILKIGVNVTGINIAFLAPLYKLIKQFYEMWLNQIEKFVKNNQIKCYAEDALNEILSKHILKPFYINDVNCKEIDDFEDLQSIKKILQKNKQFKLNK